MISIHSPVALYTQPQPSNHAHETPKRLRYQSRQTTPSLSAAATSSPHPPPTVFHSPLLTKGLFENFILCGNSLELNPTYAVNSPLGMIQFCLSTFQ